MFPISPVVVVFGLFVIAGLGAICGTVSGFLFCRICNASIRTLAKDAFLGATGAVLAWVGCALLPWPRNTVTRTLAPGIRVETTMSRFQHPLIAAAIIAVMLPAMYELLRSKRMQREGLRESDPALD